MTDRQSTFLKQIIENHIATAEPIASGFLASQSKVSSATVRNDMASLEEEGYIEQPHTSAGRIPTLKGYQYYLEHFLASKKPSSTDQKKINLALKDERGVKSLAKELAVLSNQTVLVAFADNDFFYTGISHLFSQPEFQETQAVLNISSVLDALDETLQQLYDTANKDVQILMGEENPFSARCSLLLKQSRVDTKKNGVIAILGPSRMNYNRNIGLLDFSTNLLNQSLK